jgi:single-strand DNA-binding protein
MVNRVILVGRVCTDPEMKYTPSGVAVANFRIAVDRPFANAQGERETDFIDVVAWRKDAEFVNNYLGKGRLILVEGRLQIRQWQAQDGQRRRTAEVVADSVRGLDRPREAREGGEAFAPAAPRAQSHQAPREEFSDAYPTPDFEVPDITDPFADQ